MTYHPLNGRGYGHVTIFGRPFVKRLALCGGMEADYLHFKPGGDFHIPGGINGMMWCTITSFCRNLHVIFQWL